MLLPFRVGELYGYCDCSANEIVAPRYSHATETCEGLAVAVPKESTSLLVFVDSSGNERVFVKQVEHNGYSFVRGLMSAKSTRLEEKRIGFLDQDGEWAIEPQFVSASHFDAHGAIVKINNEDQTKTRIDRSGTPIGQKWLSIRLFHPEGNYCGARIDWFGKGMMIINGRGEAVSDRRFEVVWQEHEGLIPVCYEYGSVGWLNTAFEDVYQLPANGVGNHFESGRVPVEQLDGRWGLMDVNGKWIIDPVFDMVEAVGPNRYQLMHVIDTDENTLARLADADGNFIGEHQFEQILPFSEGVARVTRKKVEPDYAGDADSNFIDLDGNILLPRWW